MSYTRINPKTNPVAQRLKMILFFFALLFCIILVRTFYLQIIENDAYNNYVVKAYERKVYISPKRGNIYDTNSNLIAASLPSQSVYLIKSKVKDLKSTLAHLIKIFSFQPDQFIKKVLQNQSDFIWVKKHALEKEIKTLLKLNLAGLYLIDDSKRYYPKQRFASQLIGFTGIETKGLEGIEHKYDQFLLGKNQKKSVLNRIYPRKNANQSGAIKLTLVEEIQYHTQKQIKKAVIQSDAQTAFALVMETKTGAILASAAYPDYNPNIFRYYKQRDYFNESIGFEYEPGSTFKIITTAIARKSGFVQKEDTFDCENGEYKILDHVIKDTTGKYQILDIKNILKKSSNICAAKIGFQIPKKVFYEEILNFGFGRKTDIAVSFVPKGTIKNYEEWTSSDHAAISYGYSILVSPLQLLAAINSIANKGMYVQPRVVKEYLIRNNAEVQQNEIKSKRIISEALADELKEYMYHVTQNGGTGHAARFENISIGGKTGTTRKLKKDRQAYSTEKHIVSFVGFFPLDDPILTIMVVVNEPKKKYLGAKSAAPVFREIAKNIFHVYQPLHDLNALYQKSDERRKSIFTNN